MVALAVLYGVLSALVLSGAIILVFIGVRHYGA